MKRPFIDRLRALSLREIERLQGRIARLPDGPERGYLIGQVWALGKTLGQTPEYFSEAGQDEFLDRVIFNRMRDGVFVDVGAFDGVRLSNTLFFETFRNWTGLCIEASPLRFNALAHNRRGPRENFAVADIEQDMPFVEVVSGLTAMGGVMRTLREDAKVHLDRGELGETRIIKVPALRLETLLDRHGLRRIDYLSLDIEGGEMAVLRGFPFEAFDIDVWSIEVSGLGTGIPDLMQRKGYKRVLHIGADQIFVRR